MVAGSGKRKKWGVVSWVEIFSLPRRKGFFLLHNNVNVLNTTEQNTSKWLRWYILCYV